LNNLVFGKSHWFLFFVLWKSKNFSKEKVVLFALNLSLLTRIRLVHARKNRSILKKPAEPENIF
jgi:hypothetical protein